MHDLIFNSFYCAQLVVNPAILSSNLVVKLGVFIGTIPIRSRDSTNDDRTRNASYESSTHQISADCSRLDEQTTQVERTVPPFPLEDLANLSIDPIESAIFPNQLGNSTDFLDSH